MTDAILVSVLLSDGGAVKSNGAGCWDCSVNPGWLRKAPGSPQRASGCSFGRKLGKDSSKHGEVDGCGGSIALRHIKPKIPKQTFPRSNKYIVLREVLFRIRFTADRFFSLHLHPLGLLDQHNNRTVFAVD